jgi:predicted nucleic acid-binding protein
LIVLDTTVFLHAVGGEHPLKAPSERLLESVATGRTRATTTVGVLQEFAAVRARRRPRSDAVRLARAFARLVSPLLAVGENDLDLGLKIFDEHTELGSFDAVLAAVAINGDAAALVSADRAFARVRRLRYVDPAGRDLDELLGSPA